MLSFLGRIFRIKTKELEANLYPTPSCTFGGKGEIELSWYSDRSLVAELSLKHSGIPDGSEIEFYCGQDKIGTARVTGGYVKLHETYENMDVTVPTGTSGEIRMNGTVLYSGEFQPD